MKPRPERSKYGVRTDAIGRAARTFRESSDSDKPRVYASLGECQYAKRLHLEWKAGKLLLWTCRNARFELRIGESIVGHYLPDFYVIHKNGRDEYIEWKGARVRDWVLREKLFRALFPGLRLTVVGK